MDAATLANLILALILVVLTAGIGALFRFASRLTILEVGNLAWHVAHDKQDDTRHEETRVQFASVKDDLHLVREGLHKIQGQLASVGLGAWLERRDEELRQRERDKR